mmetsp:Transcript_31900/g.60012  ORF Transcript_31900/g.60012 Transcript_31900/m.60012 type:complete len:227 (-) Transcript_31900:239-919(-)
MHVLIFSFGHFPFTAQSVDVLLRMLLFGEQLIPLLGKRTDLFQIFLGFQSQSFHVLVNGFQLRSLAFNLIRLCLLQHLQAAYFLPQEPRLFTFICAADVEHVELCLQLFGGCAILLSLWLIQLEFQTMIELLSLGQLQHQLLFLCPEFFLGLVSLNFGCLLAGCVLLLVLLQHLLQFLQFLLVPLILLVIKSFLLLQLAPQGVQLFIQALLFLCEFGEFLTCCLDV